MGRLGIFVPASKSSGLGHFYRTLPIYEKSDLVTYLSHDSLLTGMGLRHLQLRPEDKGFGLVERARKEGLSALYIDHYEIEAAHLRELEQQTLLPIAYFDGDFKDPGFRGLVNSNPFARANMYESLSTVKDYFLGAEYHLFRREIMGAFGALKSNRCMICFGGTDAANLTLKLLPTLDFSAHYVIVLGPGAGKDYTNAVREKADLLGLKHDFYVDPSNFFQLLSECERAMISCSSILYEALFLGVKVGCYVVAENQSKLANFSRDQGIEVIDIRSQPIEPIRNFRHIQLNFGQKGDDLCSYLLSLGK